MQNYEERRRTCSAKLIADDTDLTTIPGVMVMPTGGALYPAEGGAYLPVRVGEYLEQAGAETYRSVPAVDFEAAWEQAD